MFNVRIYFETGYDLVNIPINGAALDDVSITHYDCPAIDLLQKKNLAHVTIKKPSALDIGFDFALESADYVRIQNTDANNLKNVYYSILSYEMLSADTAKLFIAEDYITTAGGVERLEITSGILTRHSVYSNQSPKNSAIDDEYLGCLNPLVLEMDIVSEGSGVGYDFVESTVDLTQGISYQSITDGNITQLVPIMDPAGSTTYETAGKQLKNPTGAQIFTPSGQNQVSLNMSKARSLGIENAILNQYTVPSAFCTFDAANSKVTGTNDYNIATDIEIAPTPDPSDNIYNFLYGSSLARIGLISASGDRIELRPQDVAYYDERQGSYLEEVYERQVKIVRVVDPRADGRPFYRFKNVFKSRVASDADIEKFFYNCIKGAQWSQAPLRFNQVSGLEVMQQKFTKGINVEDRQFAGTQAQLKNALAAARFNEGFSSLTKTAGFGIDTFKNIGLLAGGGILNPATAGKALMGEATSAAELIGSQARNMAITNAAEIAQATSEGVYYQQRVKELYEYGVQSSVAAPAVEFPGDVNTLRDIIGNGCIVYKLTPDYTDLLRLTRIVKMFGRKTYKSFSTWYGSVGHDDDNLELLGPGKYFTYIEAKGVEVRGSRKVGMSEALNRDISPLSKAEREGIATQFSAGVRVWKLGTPKSYPGDQADPLNL